MSLCTVVQVSVREGAGYKRYHHEEPLGPGSIQDVTGGSLSLPFTRGLNE